MAFQPWLQMLQGLIGSEMLLDYWILITGVVHSSLVLFLIGTNFRLSCLAMSLL